jgi:hemolysin activation/secretion protein
VVEGPRLWNVYGRAATKESVSKFGGFVQQDVDLTVLTLGASGEHQGDASAWVLDTQFSQGVRGLGGEVGFSVVRINASWLERFSNRMQGVVRGGLQYSPTELLPAAEQFQLGGSTTVRGYSEGLLSGVSGYLASAELRYALQDPDEYLFRDSGTPLFTGFAFVDHGGAFPYRPSPLADVTKHDFLSGAGVGLSMDWENRVSARLALAWPLRDNPSEVRQREPRLHAAIAYNWP